MQPSECSNIIESLVLIMLSKSLLATSRADLSSRPILSISRGPVFVPVAEGSEWYKTEMIGVNRIGYRYVPAGINPAGHATPCRTIESNPTSFRISWEDRSSLIKVSKDGLYLAGNKGFRSARCNAPIREGKWYMEVKILHGGGERISEESRREGSHVRLGWGRREAPLNAPVGLDGYSYGYRDKTGDQVTLSRPRPYGRSFGTGDVIGMYISLPPRRQPNPKDLHDPAHLKRERIPIDLKGQEVFEILEYPASKEMMALMEYAGKPTNSGSVPSTSNKKSANGKLPERGGSTPSNPKTSTANLRPLPILHGSRIAFFVNGNCQGTAFQDIYDYLPLKQTEMQRKANSKKRTREGVKEHRENPFDDGTLGYYPFISLFNDAAVQLNPGPDFAFPPPDDIDALLDTMASPAAPTKTESNTTTFKLSVPDSIDFKPDIPNAMTNPEMDIQTLHDTSRRQTWRPALERYPEFMQEEWAFDAREEADAKLEVARQVQIEAVEEEKRKQKEKRKEQAEARKKARKEAAEKISKNLKEEDAREKSSSSTLERPKIERGYTPLPLILHGPGMPGSLPLPSHVSQSTTPGPSPLRYSTSAYDQGGYETNRHALKNGDYHELGSESHSPAPTFASFGEFQGGHSGYTSENHDLLPETDNDNDMDVDHEIEATLG